MIWVDCWFFNHVLQNIKWPPCRWTGQSGANVRYQKKFANALHWAYYRVWCNFWIFKIFSSSNISKYLVPKLRVKNIAPYIFEVSSACLVTTLLIRQTTPCKTPDRPAYQQGRVWCIQATKKKKKIHTYQKSVGLSGASTGSYKMCSLYAC